MRRQFTENLNALARRYGRSSKRQFRLPKIVPRPPIRGKLGQDVWGSAETPVPPPP